LPVLNPFDLTQLAGIGAIVVIAGSLGELHRRTLRALAGALGFVWIQRSGTALADVAEATVPGADVPQEHEGGRTVYAPAFMQVRASSFLADRHQSLFADQGFDFGHHFRRGNTDL
jgi:hypothetical protein